jgi:hypothetical protein
METMQSSNFVNCTQIIFIAKICAHMRQIMCTQLGGLIDLSPFK